MSHKTNFSYFMGQACLADKTINIQDWIGEMTIEQLHELTAAIKDITIKTNI